MKIARGFVGSASNSDTEAYVIAHSVRSEPIIRRAVLAGIFVSPILLLLILWIALT